MGNNVVTVKGTELHTLAGQDKAVKIGGRWYWFIRMEDNFSANRIGFAVVVPVAKDPRVSMFGVQDASRHASCILRLVWADHDHPVRVATPPVWDHITRRIARETEV